LAQEGHLPEAFLGQLLHLADYVTGMAASFSPPGIGDDAITAEVVAPVHDVDKGADSFLAMRRQILDHTGMAGPNPHHFLMVLAIFID